MKLRTTFFLCLSLIMYNLNSQNSSKGLFSVFPNQEITTDTSGSFEFSTTFSNSGSHWEIDWNETHVFLNMMKFTHPTNANKSFELRLGKGAQVYSFISDFGEAIPPQWRQKYNENGTVISQSTPSIVNGKILSEKGNWAPWVDEVWQMVNSDQNDQITENGVVDIQNRNMHQAGSYLNNFAHRASDHTEKPFYSPIVASYYDAEKQEFTAVNWVQSEDPSYLYDGRSDCNPCFEDKFKPATLFYTKYKNLGDGMLQVDYLMVNHHETRETRFFNVPFIGIRKSSLPFTFFSNPNNTFTAIDVESFGQASLIRNTETNGWFAVSNNSEGNGSSLGFVFPNKTDGISDFRYGAALGPNDVRDAHIFSTRLLSTGFYSWNIGNAKAIRGRYFIILDSSVQNIADKIASKELVNATKTERIDFAKNETKEIFYAISVDNNIFKAEVTTEQQSNIQLNETPFLNSFPAFLMQSDTNEGIITHDPYHFSLRPYDGKLKSIKLLGYSSEKLNINPATLHVATFSKKNFNIYPNPVNSLVIINATNSIEFKDIKLFDLLGKQLKVVIELDDTKTKATLNLSSLKKGVYSIYIDGISQIILKN